MFKIVHKRELNASVTLMDIEAPFIAKKAKAGQFIIFRIDEKGERVPLTIAGYDREKGTVTIIFQKVGFATNALGIAPGDRVMLESPYGAIETGVVLDPNLLPGCVNMYHGYSEADVNTLLPADYLDPYSGFPGYKAIACRIIKV